MKDVKPEIWHHYLGNGSRWQNPLVIVPSRAAWRWGIDTLIPMRVLETQGKGKDRRDCMRQFRAAWDRFAADEAPRPRSPVRHLGGLYS
jgi:hypothetical protein